MIKVENYQSYILHFVIFVKKEFNFNYLKKYLKFIKEKIQNFTINSIINFY